MKILTCVLFVFFFLQDNSFFEKIINDFSSKSYYLVLNVKANNYNGIAIIENDDLCLYYQIIQHGNKNEYKTFIRDILTQKTYLDLGNVSMDKWGFEKVKESKKINNSLKRGLDKFIRIYFDENMVEKGKANEEEKAYIIKILFENERSCFIDDETGLLILSKD